MYPISKALPICGALARGRLVLGPRRGAGGGHFLLSLGPPSPTHQLTGHSLSKFPFEPGCWESTAQTAAPLG